jgi:hypothetical protein
MHGTEEGDTAASVFYATRQNNDSRTELSNNSDRQSEMRSGDVAVALLPPQRRARSDRLGEGALSAAVLVQECCTVHRTAHGTVEKI